MANDVRVTVPVLHILAAMLEGPADQECYGLELSRVAGLKTGTIYPVLARLEQAGWLSSRWEDTVPSEAGRPRRRLYRLTGEGEAAASRALGTHLDRVAPMSTPRRLPQGVRTA
jgi:PadR family transcriptional regulator PadR